MHAGPTVALQELGHGGVVADRLEQLQEAVPDGDERLAYPVAFHRLAVRHLRPVEALVVGNRLL